MLSGISNSAHFKAEDEIKRNWYDNIICNIYVYTYVKVHAIAERRPHLHVLLECVCPFYLLLCIGLDLQVVIYCKINKNLFIIEFVIVTNKIQMKCKITGGEWGNN